MPIYISFSSVIIGLLCCLWLSPIQAQTIEVSELSINEAHYSKLDFGQVTAKKRSKKVLILYNTGTAPLQINRLEPGCSCTKARLQKNTIPAGGQTKLTICWRPIDDSEFSSSLIIHSNAQNHPELWIQIEGNVVIEDESF